MSDALIILAAYVLLGFGVAALCGLAGRGRSERAHALDEQARAEMAERRERSRGA